MISQIAKASLRSEIVVDFGCYVDTEIGLIRLIRDKYRDEKVFDIDKLDASINQIILSLIDRQDINPLSVIANNNVNEKDLLDYYIQFFTEEYDEILKRSVSTELKSLFSLFKSETSINVTFLCESEDEERVIRSDKDLNNCKVVVSTRDKVNFSNYTAFMFKFITDDVQNYLYQYKNYYFSRYRLNFDDQYNIIRPDIIDKIIYNGGSVEIIDLYNKSYLRGEEAND